MHSEEWKFEKMPNPSRAEDSPNHWMTDFKGQTKVIVKAFDINGFITSDSFDEKLSKILF
jgi:hypothetical protein